jgi:hypothetical protein
MPPKAGKKKTHAVRRTAAIATVQRQPPAAATSRDDLTRIPAAAQVKSAASNSSLLKAKRHFDDIATRSVLVGAKPAVVGSPSPVRPALVTSSELDFNVDVDYARWTALCRSMLLVTRTNLAQFRDIDGLLAQRRGVVCDPRLLESVSAMAGWNLTPAGVGGIAALFHDWVAVEWVRLPSHLNLVLPRIRSLQAHIPAMEELEKQLRQAFPTPADARSALASAKGPSSALLGPATSAVEGDGTLQLRFAEALDADIVIPSDLDGFLSESRASALRQAIAFKRYAQEQHVVEKAEQQSALDLVLTCYDRLRAHFVRGGSTVGATKATGLLAQLSTDARPVDESVARSRLELLLSFTECGLRQVADDGAGVLVFSAGTANRVELSKAVTARGNSEVPAAA